MRALIFIIILFISGFACSGQNNNYSQLESRKNNNGNWLLYKRGDTKPFTGTAEKLYSNGKISNEDEYINGKFDGKSILYFSTGKLSRITYYTDGKYNGETIIYHDNGKIQSKKSYKNGIQEGAEITYFPSGKICSYVFYKEGATTDTATYWYENGKKNIMYVYKNGKMQNYFRWDTIGNILNECYYNDYNSFVKDISWYTNGEKKSESILINGLMDSTFTVWYETGAIKEIIHYSNGEWNGLWTDYDIKGNITSQGEYKNDQLIKGDQMYMIVEL